MPEADVFSHLLTRVAAILKRDRSRPLVLVCNSMKLHPMRVTGAVSPRLELERDGSFPQFLE